MSSDPSQTLAALEASHSLIVLCSPDAARSKYVNEEIRHFKAIGRSDRVIPVIVGGVPGDPDRDGAVSIAHEPRSVFPLDCS